MKIYLLIFILFISSHTLAQVTYTQQEVLAKKAYEDKNYTKALALLKELVQSKQGTNKAEVAYLLAHCVEEVEGVEASKKYYKKVFNSYPTNTYATKAANVLGIFFKQEAQYDSALFYFNLSAANAIKFNYAAPFSNLRKYYLEKGDYPSALRNAYKALKIDETNKDSLGIALSYTDIGEIEEIKTNYALATDYYLKSIAIQKKINSIKNLSRNYENLGNINNTKGDINKALYWYKKALANDMKIQNKRGMAFSMMQIGNIYFQIKNVRLGNQYYQQAEPLFKNYTSAFDNAVFQMNYGFAMSQNKQWNDAIYYYKNATVFFEKEQTKSQLEYVYKQLAFCNEQRGNYPEAITYLRKYQAIREEISNEKIQNQLNQLTIEFETEKKEKKIALQEKQLSEAEKTKQQYWIYGLLFLLVALLTVGILLYSRLLLKKKAVRNAQKVVEQNYLIEELEAFNYSVTHDIRQPLITLSSVLTKVVSDTSTSPTIKTELQKGFQVLQSADELILGLLHLSKITHEELHFSTFDSKQLVISCINEVVYTSSTIIQVSELPVIEADRLQMKQVFMNLLSNSFKFSAKALPHPIVNIECEETKDAYIFSISDNGIGFTVAESKKLFQPFSRLQPKETFEGIGFGLVIVKRIIEKHNGKIEAFCNNNLTTFRFSIPK